MAGAGLITVAVLLAVGVLSLAFGLLGFVLRALGLLGGQRQLGPHEINRRRATGAAFVAALCAYVLHIGAWPLDELPPWVPVALMAVAGVSLLFVLAGLAGARGAPRDPSGVVASLVVAGGGAALLRWQCYVPPDYFAADYIAADEINRLLPGVYIAAVTAGLVRAVICVQPFGGARQLAPHEIARVRAVGTAFVLVFCLYVLWAAELPLGELPAWVRVALMVVAGLSLLFLLSGLYGTRNGPRDLHGVIVSLVVAGVGAALIWWQWQLPPGDPAAEIVNRLLPGLYIAVLIAALVRALICAQLLGGAQRIIARAIRQRAMRMRPASASGFWAEMRDSFERGRDGRRWRD